MRRFDAPIWRVIGSIVSWLLFSTSFTLLYLGSSVVMGLGGSCASGGPYEIAVPCPDSVALFVPLSIWTGIIAVALGIFLARGFGPPLISWAWPVLFIGLGVAFLIASAQPGGITFLFLGLMFVAMGAVPLVIEFRASPQRLFLGLTNVAGARFTEGDSARTGIAGAIRRSGDEGESIAPTGGDWSLSLGILAATVGLGVYLATLLFRSTGG